MIKRLNNLVMQSIAEEVNSALSKSSILKDKVTSYSEKERYSLSLKNGNRSTESEEHLQLAEITASIAEKHHLRAKKEISTYIIY